jgi:hypothetical protein
MLRMEYGGGLLSSLDAALRYTRLGLDLVYFTE